jgi:predicted dienelactone hydrolase
MIPAYLVTGYWLISSCLSPAVQPGIWTGTVVFVMLVTAAALGNVLPVFDLPKPTGAFPVGTVTRHLIDAAREETQSGRSGEPRELMVQIWYPADRAGPGQPYRKRSETEFKKAHLALVRTHAATGTAFSGAQARYPVVIFLPSWTGRRNQNTVQTEELASHGFVVVGLDHPYGTDLTVFPDGRAARTTLGDFLNWATDESLEQTVRNAEVELQIRVADVCFILDELQRLDRSDPQGLLTGRLDLQRVGIFGHSFGGSVAAEVCLKDARLKAGMDLDGFFFAESLTHRIGKPFMILGDGTPLPTPAELEASRGAVHREQVFVLQNVAGMHYALSGARGYILGVCGAAHMNFCDSPLYSPIRRFTHAGRIRPRRAMEIINAYLLSFFETHLNGNDDPLLEAPCPRYPEVDIQVL